MNARIQITHPFTHEIALEIWSFPMQVSYTYEAGEPGTFDHPGYPPNAVLERCVVGGVDISEMLSLDQRERLEEKILENIE